MCTKCGYLTQYWDTRRTFGMKYSTIFDKIQDGGWRRFALSGWFPVFRWHCYFDSLIHVRWPNNVDKKLEKFHAFIHGFGRIRYLLAKFLPNWVNIPGKCSKYHRRHWLGRWSQTGKSQMFFRAMDKLWKSKIMLECHESEDIQHKSIQHKRRQSFSTHLNGGSIHRRPQTGDSFK